MMSSLFEKIKILIFPKRCEICGEVIEFDKHICNDCKNLPVINPPICLKCGCNKDDCVCKKHKRRENEYKAVIAPYYYEGSVKKGVLNLKMHEMPKLANSHGVKIAEVVKEYYGVIDFDFVTFIPMSKRDFLKRGFNQSKLLAEVVSKNCKIPLVDALYKSKKTKKQKKQHAKDRFVNMYNAFKVNDNADIVGAKVLIVDDVKTTGATLSSAALTLKANGAKEVYCATFGIVK